MEKSRRKSNPTKIERKGANMAGDGKDQPSGRKDSSQSFFKNEIEWEKRRLQRMKHLKCCPRVPNRVLAALAMGDTQGEHKSLPSSEYMLDGKYNTDTSCVTVGEGIERGSHTCENLFSEQGSLLLITPSGRETGDGHQGHISPDGVHTCEAPERVDGDPGRSLEERSKFDNEPFDTEAFLCTTFGTARETNEISTISFSQTEVSGSRFQFLPSSSTENLEQTTSHSMQKKSEMTSRSSPESTTNRSCSSEQQKVMQTAPVTHSQSTHDGVGSGNFQGEDSDMKSSERETDFPRLIKTEVCEETDSNGQEEKWRPEAQYDMQSLPYGRVPKLEPSDFGEKESPKAQGSPVINLFHSVDSSFPLPAIIKQAKERSLALSESQSTRPAFIDLNSTKSVTQEHVLKSIHGHHHGQNVSPWGLGSYIVLETKEKRERPNGRSPENASSGLSSVMPGTSASPSEAVDRRQIASSKSENISSQESVLLGSPSVESLSRNDSLDDMNNEHENCTRESSSDFNTSPRRDSVAAEARVPRPGLSIGNSSIENYPFSSSSPMRKSPVVGSGWSSMGKKPDGPGLTHSDQHRQCTDGDHGKVTYPTYDSVYERGPFLFTGRNVASHYGAPKRVHPDFQHLNSVELTLREKGYNHALQDSIIAAKIPRSDGSPHMSSKDLPLASSRTAKTKLTSLVTPHQNQSLTLRWSGSRHIQQGRNYLVPRMIGEDNVSNLFDPLEISPNKLSQWTSRDVCRFLEQTDCREYANVFLQQEIDGKTLLVLTEEQISRLLKIKIGPAIKIYTHIANLRNILSQI